VRKEFPQLLKPRLVAANGPAPGSVGPGSGQADAFRRTILPHLDGAYDLACYLTRDPILSEDLVQDSFLRAFKAFPQFRGGSAKAWLFTIVRNCCRSAMSTRNATAIHAIHEASLSEHEARQVEQHPDTAPDPEQSLIQREEAVDVRQLLNALPEPFREALVLRELEELSYKEIAEVTGVAIGTVMSRLARARAIISAAVTGRVATGDDSRSSA
jgi:RNA polymerase sigma factor (sigma-70 family)